MKKDIKRYYKTEDGKLISFNSTTNVYKWRNTIEKIDKRISTEDFQNLKTQELKLNEFSRLMNNFFKNVKHEWEYEGVKYRAIDNFESSKHAFSTNYILGKDIPFHSFEQLKYIGQVIMVYHWGKVYYHTISYGGYPQGQLINPKTFDIVRWCQLKHCRPIFNTQTKKII